jgi:phenylacetate-CoA ligase
MPFIRYRLGDEVTVGPAPCPCGSPYGTISEILGRMTDFLRLPGGREVFANIVAVVIQDGAPWVGRYEFVQEREDRVELRVVPLSPPGPDVLADLKKRIGAQLGPGVDLRLEIVPDIVRGPGGKYRVLRSKLDSPYDREA